MTTLTTPSGGYESGVCNIGPAEIARRRRSGHVSLIVAIGLLAVLVMIGVPPIWRLLVALPAAGAAAGYLQARRHFCAGFAMQGVFNLGELGAQRPVADADLARRDRSAALWLFGQAVVIGSVVGILAVLLPI